MTAFERVNPIVYFLIFFFGFFVTFMTFNPIVLLISFISAWCLFFILKGWKSALKNLGIDVLVVALSTLINPIFSHEGITKLYYFAGNVVTAESMIYGAIAGVMVCAALLWSMCLTALLKSEGVVYIFGKVLPQFGVLLNLTLGMIPKLRQQYKRVDDSLYALGLYNQANWFKRVRLKIQVFSTTLAWAIEKSVTTAECMQARGYGLMHRKVYNLYGFGVYNAVLLVLSIVCGIIPVVCMFMGACEFFNYPEIIYNFKGLDILVYITSIVLMNMLSILYVGDNIKWNLLRQKI